MSENDKELAPGTILDRRYRILAEETRQDLGAVYQAYDVHQGRQVALLVLDPRWGTGERALRHLEKLQQRVAGTAAPGLLPYEHVGMVNGRLYVVRAGAEEQTLADLYLKGQRMELERVVELAIALCEALAPAHRAGLVHGGLSPQSVLLGTALGSDEASESSVALVDAGLLPALHATAATQGRPWGRTPYLSPEQAAGEQVHPTSDVYVIGCLLYEMLTGRLPFRSSDETVLVLQHLRHEPPSLQVLLPHAPLALAQIVHRAMAKEPAVRYRNAGQLAYILKTQVGSRQEESPIAPVAASASQPVWERLVVPPPPVPSQVADWSDRDNYVLDQVDDWSDESAGVDWLMIGLVIAALIAVLGLIPLWRTVYRRYTGPVPASAAGLRLCIDQEALGSLQPALDNQTEASAKLDDLKHIWYNSRRAQVPLPVAARPGTLLASQVERKSPSLGVQLTGFRDKI
jgi:serine/threonine protein kinase